MPEHDCLQALATLVVQALDERHDDQNQFLSTAAVAARYGVDTRTARDIARKAGAIKLGQGFQIRLDHLRTWEDEQAQDGSQAFKLLHTPAPSYTVSRSRRAPQKAVPEELEPGWWREE